MKNNPQETKARARGFSRDMSPKAISRRLKIVAELNKLCEHLSKATPITLKGSSAPESPRTSPEKIEH